MDNKPFRKPLKVFMITFAAAVAFVLILSATLSVFYEKAIVRYMKSYLDDHLLTQLSMDEIHFKVLKGFPKATVEIKNVVLLSGQNFSRKEFRASSGDTLLKAESIYLQFNMLKMLRKEYELKEIEVSHGIINILFDSKNRDNLTIWKSDSAKGQTYAVNLRSITITSTKVHVESIRQKFQLDALSERTHFKGNLSGNILSGDVKGDFRIVDVTVKDKKYVNRAAVQLDLSMIYSSNHFKITEGKVQLNKASANIHGEYAGGKKSSIDLTLNMPKFGLEELVSIIPAAGRFNTGAYSFSGNGTSNLVIKGSFSDLNHFLIKSDFKLSNCSARNINTKETLSNVNLEGSISGTNKSNFRLRIDTLDAQLGKGKVSARFNMGNLNAMAFTSSVYAKLDLKALKEFAGIDTLEKLSGFILSDFSASGNLREIRKDSSLRALNFIKKGSFIFDNAGIKFTNAQVLIEQISGRALWNEAIQLDSMSMKLNETQLLVDGNIKNLAAYLLYHRYLEANLSINTDNLDISKYLSTPTNGKSSSGYKSLSIFPAGINLKASIQAKEFTAGKFSASQLVVNMSAFKDSVYLENFSLKFPDGSIQGQAFITVDSKHNISVTCNAQPQKINIQQLFYAFNNFTQHFIMDKNIRGQLGGTVSFFTQWDSALRFNASSMQAKGDFQITNGELVQFEPMLKLSKYIDVDELRHIKFKTLKNTIYISDRVVSIPEMAIHSSAFNISVAGQHTFDNEFDYRMKVLLSEVLFNKARKKKKEIDEFLVEESGSDQTTIPLIIAGTPGNFDVKFDRKKAFNLTRSKLKNGGPEESVRSQDVRIEWETPATEKKQETTKKTSDSDISVEWDE
jgi:hypothetical protein